MADAQPDYFVEQQRTRMNIAKLRTQIEQQKLEIMEMASRKAKARESIAASEKAVVGLEETLEKLIATHGAPPEEDTDG